MLQGIEKRVLCLSPAVSLVLLQKGEYKTISAGDQAFVVSRKKQAPLDDCDIEHGLAARPVRPKTGNKSRSGLFCRSRSRPVTGRTFAWEFTYVRFYLS